MLFHREASVCYNSNRMIRKKAIHVLQVLIGTFILAVSVEFFVLPYSILSGGVAGIAVALEPFFHIDETLAANVMMICLLILGWLMLGREFGMNTMISSLAYPVFTTFLSRYPVELTIEPILASFYAGFLGGIGIGIVMRAGASTGGMDIPPLILNKLTGIKIATLVMITDALTVALGIAAYDISSALVGLVSVFASGYAINRVLEAGQGTNAKSVQIISDDWQMIKQRIYDELERGVTLLEGQGGYSNTPRKVILCVVSQRQYAKLMEIVNETDPTAFVITTDATDMHGEGFTYSSPNI